MTDITTELAPPLPEDEVTRLTAEVDRLRALLESSTQREQDAARRFGAVQEDLQSAIMDLEDEDFADQVVDFLNESTPWEFSLEQYFNVEVTLEVLVRARSADAARDMIEDRADIRVRIDGYNLEINDLRIEDVELA